MEIKVEGLDELEKQLLKLEAKAAGNVLRNALREAAKPIQLEARERAPVASETITRRIVSKNQKGKKTGYKEVKVAPGFLRRSIGLSARTGGRNGRDSAIVKVRVRKAAFWGVFFEFGTKHIAKRPFMRPAFDNNYRKVIANFGKILQRRIYEVTQK